MALLWFQFAAATLIILGASQFLARSADTVADRTGLGRSFVGVVMLATATSLPEVGTGISSIALLDAPDLAIGDAFGSSVFNLMILGLADIYWKQGPLLGVVRKTSVLIGGLGVGLIALAVMALFIHNETTVASEWLISPITAIVLVVFFAAMLLIYLRDRREQETDPDQSEAADAPDAQPANGQTLPVALTLYALSAAVVVSAAVWMANTGENIAEAMHWEDSFVGTQFLAISTSLPEIGTSFAALRINAPDLAVTNVLGSNVFNMGFILFIDDIIYTDGVVWTAASTLHILTGLFAILMTAVVIVAVMSRAKSSTRRLWTPEGALLVGSYIGSSALFFALS